jgi:hypothetical protein
MITIRSLGDIKRDPASASRASYDGSRNNNYSYDFCRDAIDEMAKRVNDGDTLSNASRDVLGRQSAVHYMYSRFPDLKRRFDDAISRDWSHKGSIPDAEKLDRAKAFWDLVDDGAPWFEAAKKSKCPTSNYQRWMQNVEGFQEYWDSRREQFRAARAENQRLRRQMSREEKANMQTAPRAGEPPVIETIKPVESSSFGAAVMMMRSGAKIRRKGSSTVYQVVHGRVTEMRVVLKKTQVVGLAYFNGQDVLALDWEVANDV